MMKIAALSLSLIILSACLNREPDKTAVREDVELTDTSASRIDFSVTDSVEMIEYPDPSDQKVYTFKRSADTQLIRLLIADLSGMPVVRTPCTHYRKLYLFDSSEVFKTVYVSDSCKYLAYSVNGTQQFRALSPALMNEIGAGFSKTNPK